MGVTKWDPRSLDYAVAHIGSCQRWVVGFLHADSTFHRRIAWYLLGAIPSP